MVLVVSAFTDWFNEAMAERGLGVRQFANQASVSHTTVLNWTRGATPSYEYCANIARAFRLSVEQVRAIAGYGPSGDSAVAGLDPDEEMMVRAWRVHDRLSIAIAEGWRSW